MSSGRFAGLLDRGEEDRHQDRDDRNDDEEFDQRETLRSDLEWTRRLLIFRKLPWEWTRSPKRGERVIEVIARTDLPHGARGRHMSSREEDRIAFK